MSQLLSVSVSAAEMELVRAMNYCFQDIVCMFQRQIISANCSKVEIDQFEARKTYRKMRKFCQLNNETEKIYLCNIGHVE